MPSVPSVHSLKRGYKGPKLAQSCHCLISITAMSAAARAAFEDRGLSFEQDAAFQLADALAKETGCKMGNLVRQYEAWAANR